MLGVATQCGYQSSITAGIYENNVTLIDSHILFITELFNVGIIGTLSLIFMICLILYEQIKVIIIKTIILF